MTTTVTLKTHDWPVRVSTTDAYQTEDRGVLHTESETVPAHAEREFYITDTRSLVFEELPQTE